MKPLIRIVAPLALLILADCHKKPGPIGQPANWLTALGGGTSPVFDDSKYILLGGYQSSEPKLIARVLELKSAGNEKVAWQLMDGFDLQAVRAFQEVVVDAFDEQPGVTRGHFPNDPKTRYFVTETVVHPPLPKQKDGACLPLPPTLKRTVYFDVTEQLAGTLGPSAKFAKLEDQGVAVWASQASCAWAVHAFVDLEGSETPKGASLVVSPLGGQWHRAWFNVEVQPWSTRQTVKWVLPNEK